MIKSMMEKYIPKIISKKEASDTGMALVLISLLIGYFTQSIIYFKIAIPLLIMNMTFPMFYYPFAIIWLGLTNLMGAIVSKIVLSVIYLIIVVPTGRIRRLMGKDSLNLNAFKKNKGSVMITRDYKFSSKDIENPY